MKIAAITTTTVTITSASNVRPTARPTLALRGDAVGGWVVEPVVGIGGVVPVVEDGDVVVIEDDVILGVTVAGIELQTVEQLTDVVAIM